MGEENNYDNVQGMEFLEGSELDDPNKVLEQGHRNERDPHAVPTMRNR